MSADDIDNVFVKYNLIKTELARFYLFSFAN